MPAPSVGRVVHYVSYGTPGGEYTSQCRAAIVTELSYEDAELTRPTDQLGLCVLNPTGFFFNEDVPADHEQKRGGTWHWPERA